MATFSAADGCRIHYETFGDRGPLVLLIPGLGGDGRFWDGVVRDLEQDHRLIVADHRGAGRSDRPEGTYSITGIASDMAALLAGFDEPAHIVGHSTGGAIAQLLALDHPTQCLSYTISSSWALADARFRALFVARAELLEAGLPETYQRLTHGLCYEPAYLAANEDRLEAAVMSAGSALAPLSVAAARVRMLLAHDCLEALPAINAPVLVIAAIDDVLLLPSMSRLIAETIPGALFQTVSGAHFHPLTNPEASSGLIRHFISQNDRETHP